MLSFRLSAVSLCLLGATLVLGGCGTMAVDDTAGWSPNRLLSEARDLRDAGNFEQAVALFEKLEGRAAGTLLAQQAQLDKAHAQYRAGEQAQALATLERFIRLHPGSPALDYALYLRGLVNFQDDQSFLDALSRQDPSERDQRAARESFEAFRELVQRFPDSRYAPDARARMRHIVNSLAQSEVNVARYYFNRGAHLAAINRAQHALTEYRDAPALEEALFILVQAYDALGMTQLRDDARRVLQENFAHSEFLSQGLQRAAAPWWRIW